MRSPRPSTKITARRSREALRAGRHSWRLGRALNQTLTIRLDEAAGDEFAPQRQMQAFLRKFSSWLRYRRRLQDDDAPDLVGPPIWEFVFEKRTRLHAHLMLHVPDHLLDGFLQAYPKWCAKVFGERSRADVDYQPIRHLNGLLRYNLKGTDRFQAHRFGIRPSDQGTIWGPHVRASRALGPTARERRIEASKT